MLIYKLDFVDSQARPSMLSNSTYEWRDEPVSPFSM